MLETFLFPKDITWKILSRIAPCNRLKSLSKVFLLIKEKTMLVMMLMVVFTASKNKNPWFYQNLTEQNEEERIHQGPIFEQLYKWKLVFLSNLETLAVANNLHYHHHVTPDVPKPLASAILKLASVPVVGTSQEPIQFMIQKLKLLVQIIVTRTALML